MCARCRRQLLTGEQFRYWRSLRAEGSGTPICALCEQAVRELGWQLAGRAVGRENAVGLRGTVRLVA